MTWLKEIAEKYSNISATLMVIAYLVGPVWFVWWMGGDVFHWFLIMCIIWLYFDKRDLETKYDNKVKESWQLMAELHSTDEDRNKTGRN